MFLDWCIVIGLLSYHCFAHYKAGKAFEIGMAAPGWLMSGLVAGAFNCLYVGTLLCK